MGIPFKEIQARAIPFTEALCRRWLPQGKRQGGWFVCCSPFRDDKSASFGVSLSTGKWRDFASGEHGDLLDLYGKIQNVTPREAAVAVARVVGHEFAESERVA